MTVVNLNVDFDKLREKSTIWIRRASVFLGLASNAASADPPISHVLDDRARNIFVPDNPSDEAKATFLEEFEIWAVANALRDLIEGHSSFLRSAHYIAEIVIANGIEKSILDARCSAFERQNIIYQRRNLTKLLNIHDDFDAMFASFVMARNCLAHRNGVVSDKDKNTKDGLEINWRFLGLKIPDKNGEYRYLDLNEGEEYFVKSGTKVQFGPVVKSKTFALNEQIRLNRHDLVEMLLGFHIAAEVVIGELMNLIPKSVDNQ